MWVCVCALLKCIKSRGAVWHFFACDINFNVTGSNIAPSAMTKLYSTPNNFQTHLSWRWHKKKWRDSVYVKANSIAGREHEVLADLANPQELLSVTLMMSLCQLVQHFGPGGEIFWPTGWTLTLAPTAGYDLLLMKFGPLIHDPQMMNPQMMNVLQICAKLMTLQY